jgi:hypothetical protein
LFATTKKKPQVKSPASDQPETSWKLSLMNGGFLQQGFATHRKCEIYLQCDTAQNIKCEGLSREVLEKDFADSHPEVAKRRKHMENLKEVQSKISELSQSLDALTSKIAEAIDLDETKSLNDESANLVTELESMKKLEEVNRVAVERLTEQLMSAARVFITNRRQAETEKALEARKAARKAFADAIEHMPELTAFSDSIALANHAMSGLTPSPETLF